LRPKTPMTAYARVLLEETAGLACFRRSLQCHRQMSHTVSSIDHERAAV
jgi:hypothetical protein